MSLRHVYHVGIKWRGAEFYTAKQREIGRVLWTLADAWMVPRLRSVIPEAFLGGQPTRCVPGTSAAVPLWGQGN